MTTVYGPHLDEEKIQFLQEIRDLRSSNRGPWAICGDFNLIYKAEYKNNNHLNRRMMGRFCRLLKDLELKEIFLHGRLFTWSNERRHATLTRIDHLFVTVDWEKISRTACFMQSPPESQIMRCCSYSSIPCGTQKSSSGSRLFGPSLRGTWMPQHMGGRSHALTWTDYKL